MTNEEKIRGVLDRFLADGGVISNRPQLQLMLAEAMGGADEFIQEGWRCVRTLGEDIPGTARKNRDCYGYVCEHVETGTIARLQPGPVDMSADYVYAQIDFWNKWRFAKGSFDGLNFDS